MDLTRVVLHDAATDELVRTDRFTVTSPAGARELRLRVARGVLERPEPACLCGADDGECWAMCPGRGLQG